MMPRVFPKIQATAVALLMALPAFAEINTPVVIPLQNADADSRLVIHLNIGGATWSEPFLFDTGSSPLTVGYSPGAPWIGTHTVNTGKTDFIIYGGGSGTQRFHYHPGTAAVTPVGSTISSPSGSSIAFIFREDTNAHPDQAPNWVENTQFADALEEAKTTNVPPFASNVFGTFGADLHSSTGGLMTLVSSQTYGPSVSKAFIVNGSLTNPFLTIGVDAATIATFENVFPMNQTGGVIDQTLISPNYEIERDGITHTLTALPTLLDTGTPPDSRLFITQGSEVDVSAHTQNGHLMDGVKIRLLLGSSFYELESTAANPIAVFGSPTDAGRGGLTYGLNFFRDYQVLYNLDTLEVGITVVPEPSVVALVVLGLGGLAFARRRR